MKYGWSRRRRQLKNCGHLTEYFAKIYLQLPFRLISRRRVVHPDLKIYIGENIYGPIELGVHFDLPVVHVFKDRQRVNVPRHPFFLTWSLVKSPIIIRKTYTKSLHTLNPRWSIFHTVHQGLGLGVDSLHRDLDYVKMLPSPDLSKGRSYFFLWWFHLTIKVIDSNK
jgi:hypothetical protein